MAEARVGDGNGDGGGCGCGRATTRGGDLTTGLVASHEGLSRTSCGGSWGSSLTPLLSLAPRDAGTLATAGTTAPVGGGGGGCGSHVVVVVVVVVVVAAAVNSHDCRGQTRSRSVLKRRGTEGGGSLFI